MRTLLIALSLTSFVGAVQLRQNPRSAMDAPQLGDPAPPPKIDTYIINLAARKDRCFCMQALLVNHTQNVYRHQAATLENWRQECPKVRADPRMRGGHSPDGEMALSCSNYKIWERAANTAADFIVVLEDDVKLSAKFTEAITKLTSSCDKLNYVVIDSFANTGGTPANICPAFPLMRPGHQHYGTHATLIRRTYLPTLMKEAEETGMGAYDWWWVGHSNGQKLWWTPNIASPWFGSGGIANCSKSSIHQSSINIARVVDRLDCN